MKSFLLSALKRQAATGKDAFVKLYAHDWLVWEAGSWKAPRAQTLVLDSGPAMSAPSTLKSAEALAIALPAQERIVLGRASGADLSINDGTLSGTHLALVRAADRWALEDLGSTNGTTVEGLVVRVGDRVPLRNGSAVKAGQVALTFHTAEGLWTRLGS